MNRNRLSSDEKEIIAMLLETAKEQQKSEFTLRAAELIAAIYGRVSLVVEPIRDRNARRVRKALARKDADLVLTDTVRQQAEDRKAAKARREAQRLLQKAEPPFIIKDPTI